MIKKIKSITVVITGFNLMLRLTKLLDRIAWHIVLKVNLDSFTLFLYSLFEEMHLQRPRYKIFCVEKVFKYIAFTEDFEIRSEKYDLIYLITIRQ